MCWGYPARELTGPTIRGSHAELAADTKKKNTRGPTKSRRNRGKNSVSMAAHSTVAEFTITDENYEITNWSKTFDRRWR